MLVLLCEMNVGDETRHDIHKSAALRYALLCIVTPSHLWRSFSHNRAKINIQFLNKLVFLDAKSVSFQQASVTKRRGIGPIRTEILPYKIRTLVVYFVNC